MSQNTTPLLLGEALQSAATVCVVTHGRGQSPEAMAEHIVSRLQTKGVAYVLPRAASGSWYDARAIDPLTDKTREQLARSLAQLKQAFALAPATVPVVIVGFSQGACLTIEYALQFGGWNGALVAFTGCRVGGPEDKLSRAPLNKLPCYISGSDADPWIPLTAFSHAVNELGAAQTRLRADIFPGRAHEVTDTEIVVLDGALNYFSTGQETLW